ncbi:MAG: hypothetical protein LCI02_07170 [Proteobacteria bacterium]|nr:hypothetical protein [Pseudomonadota bacterium]
MDVQPIREADLPVVGEFLHQHLNRKIAAQTWSDSLRHRWAAAQPNHGMRLLTPEGRLVGVLCAVYSDQLIAGKLERFCNPHSWCVLDEFRHASINLVLAVIRQRDYHFTMFTPNPKVTQVFMGLRFRLLDDALLYFPNLPALGGGFVEARPERIAQHLEGAARAEFEAHRAIPWLRFVAFGPPGNACLAIYKRGRWKKMACAMISHLSDPASMARHGPLLRRHLLLQGMPVSRIEARFVTAAPPLAYRTQRTQPKLALTRTLADAQIRDVYSELMALDI